MENLTEQQNNQEMLSDAERSAVSGAAGSAAEKKDYYEKLRETRRKREKEQSRFRLKNLPFIVIPVILAVGVFFFAGSFVGGQKWVTVRERGHQYYLGSEVTVYEDTKFKKDENGNTVTQGKNAGTAADLPVYYDSTRAVMIMEDMDYYDPRSSLLRKADAFTELAEKTNGRLRASLKDAETELDRGFLYNGKDLYLLLEPAVLEVNGCSIELPAFSYVETERGGINVFNYETKETESFTAETEATATPTAGGYELQMLGTMLVMPDGSLQLLFFEPGQLDSVYQNG